MKLEPNKEKFKDYLRLFQIGMSSTAVGAGLLSFVWFEVAKGIVKRAVEVYGLTEEQAAAIRTVFLRPSDYRITGS